MTRKNVLIHMTPRESALRNALKRYLSVRLLWWFWRFTPDRDEETDYLVDLLMQKSKNAAREQLQ